MDIDKQTAESNDVVNGAPQGSELGPNHLSPDICLWLVDSCLGGDANSHTQIVDTFLFMMAA